MARSPRSGPAPGPRAKRTREALQRVRRPRAPLATTQAWAAAAEGATAGLRDAALLRVMSDALLPVFKHAAVETEDIRRESDGAGGLTIRRSKTDQRPSSLPT